MAVVAAMAILAAALVWLSTAQGPGLSPDSVAYIGSARSLLAGNGFSLPGVDGTPQPLTHFPPLYPAVIAAATPRGTDPIETARWLDAALFAASVALAGIAVWSATGSPLAGALGAGLTLLSLPLLVVHSMAWSEPLALLLGLACALLLFRYRRDGRTADLLAAAALAAASMLTRYAGVAVLLAGCLALVSKRPLDRAAMRDTAVFALVALLPSLLWMARNASVAASLTGRQLGLYPITADELAAAARTLVSWVGTGGPAPMPLTAAIASLVLGAAVVGGWIASRAAPAKGPGLPEILALFAFVQLGFVLFSRAFADAHILLDNRMLCPAYAWGLVGIVAALSRSTQHGPLRPLAIAGLAALGVLAAGKLGELAGWVAMAREDGQGFANRSWRESPTLRAVRELPPGVLLFSNGADVLYALSGHPAGGLPARINANTRQVRAEYGAELEVLRTTLACRNAAVVYLAGVTWRWYLPSEEELVETIPLRPERQEADGSIHRYASDDRATRCAASPRP